MKSIRQKTIQPWGLICLMAYIFILYHSAWISDDAYITLRSVDNFVNGFGPVWNIGERVQVFTHPLWYLLLSSFYFFTREAFFTTLFISLSISIATFLLIAFFAKRPIAATLSLVILLASNAYIDYSTSGLENPLSHLIVCCFVFLFFQNQPNLRVLSALAGLAVFNRTDLALVFIPAFLWLFIQSPKKETLFAFIAGFMPFLLWEIFSTFYYGFPFPNTAYAKLNVQIPRLELIAQGGWYFVNSLRIDTVTVLTILCGIFIGLRSRSPKFISLAIGCGLYLFYILWIGGDFMSGRFFSVPLLISALLLQNYIEQTDPKRIYIIGAFALIALLETRSLFTNPSIFNLRHQAAAEYIDAHGIADEQTIYVSVSGLVGAAEDDIQPHGQSVYQGLKYRQSGQSVIVEINIGYLGFFVGNKVHIIDQYGLADPLLARIPFTAGAWRPGHFFTPLPKGYLETVTQNKNLIVNPALAEYYDALRLVTQGDLFNHNRLVAIWKFNTGQYDYLMDEYLRPISP